MLFILFDKNKTKKKNQNQNQNQNLGCALSLTPEKLVTHIRKYLMMIKITVHGRSLLYFRHFYEFEII